MSRERNKQKKKEKKIRRHCEHRVTKYSANCTRASYVCVVYEMFFRQGNVIVVFDTQYNTDIGDT